LHSQSQKQEIITQNTISNEKDIPTFGQKKK